MAGKYVKHKLHEEWGIGKLSNEALYFNGRYNVRFPDYTNPQFSDVMCKLSNLIVVGFYD